VLQWSESYIQTVAAQRTRWMSFLGTHSGIVDDAMRSRLKSLVRMGIPPELRHRVWRLTTGSFDKQRRAAVTYDDLLRRYQVCKPRTSSVHRTPRAALTEACWIVGRAVAFR
jgi:hypothetical protein